MANAENPLLSLSKEKQQQIVDLVDNGDIGEIAEKGGMTRRQVLQVAVALGAGATVGGYSVDQIIGEARAAADTSDSDGNVGLPGDRVDVFAEGVDVSGEVGATSVSADIINTTPPADGATKTTEKIRFESQRHVTEHTQRTTGVSTSTVEILSTEDSDLVRGAFTVVEGTRGGSAGDIFVDLVLFTRNGGATAVSSVENGVSETRTYDVSGSNLTLSFDSGTFNINALGIGSRSG